jgi:hypothetical protein
MKNGSKTVKINGKEVMLKDQSFYKTSPLGDEAATRSFGGSVITHVITGKTYFNAWSMDVKFEGANVDRHLDLTTSNHASYPGSTGPLPAMETLALERIAENKCPCCGTEPMHAGQRGEPISEEEWYDLNEEIPPLPPKTFTHASGVTAANPAYPAARAEYNKKMVDRHERRRRVAEAKKCPTKPEPPCNVYFRITKEEADANEAEWRANQARIKKDMGVQKVIPTKQDEEGNWVPERGKVDHKVPTSAGGCPTGKGNLQDHSKMSKQCQSNDDKLGDVQKECAEKARVHPRLVR